MSKKESKEKRIEDVLVAAMDVFIEKGYENASMNEIAIRAGISKGGLYHHFLSKDMVLLYANQKLMEPCMAMLDAAKENSSAVEGIKTYIHDYLGYWIERKKELIFFSMSMTKAMSHMDIFKMYERYTEDYITSFVELFKKGMQSGEFKLSNAKGSAVALMSSLDGLIIYMALDKKLKLDEMVGYFIEVFLKPLYNINNNEGKGENHAE